MFCGVYIGSMGIMRSSPSSNIELLGKGHHVALFDLLDLLPRFSGSSSSFGGSNACRCCDGDISPKWPRISWVYSLSIVSSSFTVSRKNAEGAVLPDTRNSSSFLSGALTKAGCGIVGGLDDRQSCLFSHFSTYVVLEKEVVPWERLVEVPPSEEPP
jgi:hypothetical protein